MIINWQTLLSTFLIGLLVLMTCFLTGFALFYSLKNKRKEKLGGFRIDFAFWCFLYGFFSIISIYAIITTGFQTSLLPVPVLTGLLIFYHKDDSTVHQETVCAFGRTTILLFFLVFTIYWFYFSAHFFTFQSDTLGYIGGDVPFYGRAADYLNFKKQENVVLDFFNFPSAKVEPYHYGDLWSIAVVEQFSNVNPTVIVTLVAYPVFAVFFLAGLYGYISLWVKKSIHKSVLLLCVSLAGFISGFPSLFPGFILSADVYAISLARSPKLFFAGGLLVAILISLKKKNWNQAMIMSCTCLFLFINIFPAVLISVLLLICYRTSNLRFISFKASLAAILSFLYYLGFYMINEPSHSSIAGNKNKVEVSVAVNILGGGLLQSLPFLPFFIIFLLIITQKGQSSFKNDNDIVFLLFLLGAGLLSWAVLYPTTMESVQFFYNILVPVSSIAIVLITVFAFSVKHIGYKILALLCFVVAIFANIKPTFGADTIKKSDVIKCNSFLEKYGQGLFVDLRPVGTMHKNTVVYQPLSFLSYLQNRYISVNLNTMQIPIDSSYLYAGYEQSMLESSPFYSFVKQKKKGYSSDEYIDLFIKEKKVKYLSAAPGVDIAAKSSELIKDSVLLSGGWRMYYIGEY